MDAMIIKLQILHILFLFIFIFTTVSSSSSPPSNFTLYGTARINQTAITLTQPLTNCTTHPPFPNTGRIFYKHPIRFLDSNFNSTLSFSTKFSFTIIPPPLHCLNGEGIAFLIASHTNSLPYSLGSIGLPQSVQTNSLDATFLAVEFDTNYDQRFNDINGNHVGIDSDSIFSIASIDLMSIGIDLNGGKKVNSWIEYNGSKRVIEIWVGYPDTKPDSPILTAPIDLSKRFNGFMYVGFSASNGDGSSVHLIDNWGFRTFESGSSGGSVYPDMDVEVGLENCLICFPEPHKNTRPETDPGLTKNHNKGLKLAIGLLVVNLILIVSTLSGVVLYIWLTKKESQNQNQPAQTLTRTNPNSNMTITNRMPKRLKLSEIRSLTRGFNRNLIIGDGVSAVVYKTDRNQAVKRFKTASFGSQIATEFVTMASSLQHKNIMKLQAWCCERNELILVYDYMPNGSLDKFLQNSSNFSFNFSFEARLNVLIGVSSALCYLHEECDRIIVHRNVKTSNILLDLDLAPKLGDFGIARDSRDVTVTALAMGYMAPEYVYSRVPTVKTDVYSFGVVVLEVATGRAAVDETGVGVVDWVWDMWEEKRVVAAADGGLGGEFDCCEMERVLMVGLSCVVPDFEMRPTMKEVVRMLRGEVVPVLPEVKPVVVVTAERSPEVVVKCGGDDGWTSWGTPTSHFSKT
ncbi:putative protein kinase RLK-Pelle-L-LEC family [Helianthus annuus]|nr:putative protein kinase RLK-Pelle-L-LEC family [Helianthus annuus]